MDGSDRNASPLDLARRENLALRQELASLAADREEWLTVLAHELRTPLTVICGFNRMLLSGEAGALSDEQARYLTESTRSCRRLDAFIGRLLDAAWDGFLEQGLERDDDDLVPVAEDVRRLLQPLTDEKDLDVVVEIAPDARRAHFDATRIEQVLVNLVSNAIRFTKAGGTLRMTARRVEDRDGAGRVAFSVVDQGPGIAPADRRRVFDPFVRIAPDGDRRGLGLGLTICRRIVEAHDGEITAEDAPGGGCSITFTLPIAAPAARES